MLDFGKSQVLYVFKNSFAYVKFPISSLNYKRDRISS